MTTRTIRLKGLKVMQPIPAEVLPRDLVPADGPAGNPTVTRVGRGEWGVGRGRERKPMNVRSYRDLEVWQFGMDLAEQCYRVTKDESWGVGSGARDVRRTRNSFHPTRPTPLAPRPHSRIARGSLMELETHLLLSGRIGLLDQSTLDQLVTLADTISRMLAGLRRSLEARLQ